MQMRSNNIVSKYRIEIQGNIRCYNLYLFLYLAYFDSN